MRNQRSSIRPLVVEKQRREFSQSTADKAKPTKRRALKPPFLTLPDEDRRRYRTAPISPSLVLSAGTTIDIMLIGAVTSWLGSSRPRCVFLLLCSPILLPLLCAVFPILCVAELCFRFSGQSRRKSPEELLEEDGLDRCEEGCYRACGRIEEGKGEEETQSQNEECLLNRYLEDQLLLVRFAYECEDGNVEVNGDFHFPDTHNTTMPLLG